MSHRHIAVDVMGGDYPPKAYYAAARAFLSEYSDVRLTLVGDESLIPLPPGCLSNASLSGCSLGEEPPRLNLLHADNFVTMEERPSFALRHRRSSSMWLALDMLAQGEADACVSAGNTGALMAMGRYLVKTFNGVSRPAICKPIPTAKDWSLLLDIGANMDCTAEQLIQFAEMGVAMAQAQGRQRPTVALLNVGSEVTKGNQEVQLASQLLKEMRHLDYVGFVEGDQLYAGDVDVIVCDGFTGNVALKVSEGLANFVSKSLRESMRSSWLNRCMSVILSPMLKSWRSKLNPKQYNGAALLGLQGVVVKSHGAADEQGFFNALVVAREQVVSKMPEKIGVYMMNHQASGRL